MAGLIGLNGVAVEPANTLVLFYNTCFYKNNGFGVNAMILLAYGLVSAVGLWLVGSGLYHQVNYRRLHADPVLIGGCYVMGGLCLATCLV